MHDPLTHRHMHGMHADTHTNTPFAAVVVQPQIAIGEKGERETIATSHSHSNGESVIASSFRRRG